MGDRIFVEAPNAFRTKLRATGPLGVTDEHWLTSLIPSIGIRWDIPALGDIEFTFCTTRLRVLIALRVLRPRKQLIYPGGLVMIAKLLFGLLTISMITASAQAQFKVGLVVGSNVATLDDDDRLASDRAREHFRTEV